MRWLLPLLIFATTLGRAQEAAPKPSAATVGLPEALGFEVEPKDQLPGGWRGGPRETLSADDTIKHSGKWAARLERDAASGEAFSTIMQSRPIDYGGQQIELRGYLRTEDVSAFAGLWMREDGAQPGLAFDNMEQRQLKGTTDWTEYSITLPLRPRAQTLYFGVLLSGTGRLWADDLQLLVDGKPVWEAPKVQKIQTVLDRDHEFDAGSKINLAELTSGQVGNLATLGKVWGYLKYHHPKVTGGQLHWDYELFRILPAVLAAPDRAAANAVLAGWVDTLGRVEASQSVKQDDSGLQLRPELDWLDDEKLLGAALSQRLQDIQANQPVKREQFYVGLVPNVENPVFDQELGYADIKPPDVGFQLLALFRFWNIMRYWSPNRELVEGNWDANLEEFIPRIGLARDAAEYQRQLMALIARVRDTHANLWSSLKVRPPGGDNQLPVAVRFIEGRATVTEVLPVGEQPASGLQVGDVIEQIDGVPVEKLVADWSPYFAASNEPTRLRDIARSLTQGSAAETRLSVRRGADILMIAAARMPIANVTNKLARWHDLRGDTFQLLSPDVAYLKLSSVKLADADSYLQQAAGTKGLIIDIRNYPSAFVVFALGAHLVEQPTDFVAFTVGDLAQPGVFRFHKSLQLQPKAPFYPGKVMILVDEVSQSNAEYTTMAFRVAPQAKVIGSTTAGADGNVSAIPLPGGLRTMISGIGVFYPDHRATQQVGIIPDIEIRPTLAGIRAGRDEVLEAALRQILGADAPLDEIRAKIKRGK